MLHSNKQSLRERKFYSARGINRFNIFFTAMIFLSLLCACSVPGVKADRPFDFTLQGFLDDHHFQVIVSAKPDKSIKGLVAQRESALTIARNDIQRKALADLVQYRIDIYAHEKGIEQSAIDEQTEAIKKDLTSDFLSLLSYGKVIEEYYEKDNSAVILFRIEKSNLRREIANAKITIKSISQKP
jgi:hypothetical protein